MTPQAFIPDPDFDEAASKDPEIREGLRRAAEPLAAQADSMARAESAPWMPRSGHELVEITDDGEDIWVAITDYAAHLYEYGGARSPVSAPLRRAAMAAGFEVVEQP